MITAAHTFMHASVVAAPDSSPRYADVTVQARYLGPMFEDDLDTLPIGGAVRVGARGSGHGRLAAHVRGRRTVRYVYSCPKPLKETVSRGFP
jgi:hypothetical protein